MTARQIQAREGVTEPSRVRQLACHSQEPGDVVPVVLADVWQRVVLGEVRPVVRLRCHGVKEGVRDVQ